MNRAVCFGSFPTVRNTATSTAVSKLCVQMWHAKQRKISEVERTMTKRIYMLILLACLLNLSAAGSSLADEVKVESARKCINTRIVKRTEVVDDLNILFFMRGKTVYLNILPRQCRGLSRDRRFSFRTSLGRLCNLDRIRILNESGFGLQEGKSCRLGYFHPITKEDIPEIIEGMHKLPESVPLPPAEIEDITVETDESQDSTPN